MISGRGLQVRYYSNKFHTIQLEKKPAKTRMVHFSCVVVVTIKERKTFEWQQEEEWKGERKKTKKKCKGKFKIKFTGKKSDASHSRSYVGPRKRGFQLSND